RQAVPARRALDEAQAEAPLELRQAALHGRLVDPELARRGQGAALVGDGKQVLEIVPVEHQCHRWFVGQYAVPRPRSAIFPTARQPTRRAEFKHQHTRADIMTHQVQQAGNPGLEAARAQWEAAAKGWDAQSPALRSWLSRPT